MIAVAWVLYGIYIFLAIRHCEYNSLRRPSSKIKMKTSRRQHRATPRWRSAAHRRKGGALAHD
jgi:uncharacterized protein involved in cysteine biosynthesis